MKPRGVALWGGVLGAVLVVFTVADGPFDANRIGSAGEWFAGIAGFAVLAWAVGEPARAERHIRDTERIRKADQVAESAIRRVVELEMMPGRLVYDPASFAVLAKEFEIAHAMIPNVVLRDRLAVTVTVLMVVREDGLIDDPDVLVFARSVALKVIDCCTSTLRELAARRPPSSVDLRGGHRRSVCSPCHYDEH